MKLPAVPRDFQQKLWWGILGIAAGIVVVLVAYLLALRPLIESLQSELQEKTMNVGALGEKIDALTKGLREAQEELDSLKALRIKLEDVGVEKTLTVLSSIEQHRDASAVLTKLDDALVRVNSLETYRAQLRHRFVFNELSDDSDFIAKIFLDPDGRVTFNYGNNDRPRHIQFDLGGQISVYSERFAGGTHLGDIFP